jgi:hypothetical protein
MGETDSAKNSEGDDEVTRKFHFWPSETIH